ncbi:hypothetical protein PAHAL_5G173800 [Panicum hallii]|uniref:Uncharacterized protein n=1 Tax=Panicum hallii TaxID=206008 RepID=A0A2S3HS22_9POAL|nr:uncharacterized protein LOC112891823 isoform X2 [Panicum hallii]PAN28709.1 hypothetical protein PAHAL_5G173800 [Panicum hallii]
MRALAHPRLGPLAAVRSSSDAPQCPALLRPALPFPAGRLRRLPELSPPATRHRRPVPPPTATVASGDAGGGSFLELTCPADFAAPGGRISVVGFGSLLSERSARSTFPDLEGFRVAALRGFRRVFAHAAPIFFERGIAVEATKEFSSLSVGPCEGELIVVIVFEIKEEVPAFIEREHEFKFLAVVPEGLHGVPFTNQAVVCARYSDEEYFKERCQVTETPEDVPVEPAEFVETEPGAECVVEQEENQGEPEVVFGHFYPAEPGAGEE